MMSFKIRVLIAFAVCIGTIVGYSLLYSAIEAKSSAVAGLQNQINARKETAGRVASARAALAEITGDEAIVQNYFVKENGVVAFIDDIEGRGRLQNAEVNVLSVTRDDTGRASMDSARHDSAESRPVLSFALSIKGAFDAVMRTVGTIEYAPYDIVISSLSLVQDDKNLWHADVKMFVGSVAEATTKAIP